MHPSGTSPELSCIFFFLQDSVWSCREKPFGQICPWLSEYDILKIGSDRLSCMPFQNTNPYSHPALTAPRRWGLGCAAHQDGGSRGFAPHGMSDSSPSFNKCLGELGVSIVPALLQVMYGWHVVPWGSPKPLQSLVKCWDLVNINKWDKNEGRAGVAHVNQRIVIKNCYV